MVYNQNDQNCFADLQVRRSGGFTESTKCQQPIIWISVRAITLATGAGFMLGGELRSRLGLALGMLIGRTLTGTVVSRECNRELIRLKWKMAPNHKKQTR